MNRYTPSGSLVPLVIDFGKLDKLADELAATEAQANLALKRAVNRTIQWMQTRARRALAAGLKIPQQVMRARLRTSLYSTDSGRGRVWIGLNPVSLDRLKPKRTARGVKAAGQEFPGGFIAKGRSGNRHVYKRLGKSRLPIVSLYKDIEKGAEILENKVFEGWEDFLYQRFEHELKWTRKK